MKAKILVLIVTFLSLTSCNNKETPKQETTITETEVHNSEDNSKNSVDWTGTYKGTIPCADCEGIEVEITLNDDNTFSSQSTYLGTKKIQKNVFTETGTFKWDEKGNTIKTVTSDKSSKKSYIMGEKKLIQLDSDNKEITGPLAENYVLKQIEKTK